KRSEIEWIAEEQSIGHGCAAARSKPDPRRERGICARKRFLRFNNSAQSPRRCEWLDPEIPFSRQERQMALDGHSRQANCPDRQELPGAARPGNFSIYRRRGKTARHQLQRRE